MEKKTKKKTTKKKLTGHQFKKGHKKSVGFGRPPMSDAEKELSLKTRTQFKNILNKYMITDEKELQKLYKSKKLPILDGMIIKSLLNVFSSGSQAELNWFLNHSLGKEKETTNINLTGGMENTNTVNLKKLSKEDLLVLKDLAEKNEK